MYKELILVLSFIFVTQVVDAKENNGYATEIEAAETKGDLLYKQVQAKDKFNLKSLDNYKAVKAHLAKVKCSEFTYKPYLITFNEKQNIYFVGSRAFAKNVIIGRHFKSTINNNIVDLAGFSSSTNGCLNLGSVEKNVAGMYASHLQPYPNEFHVFQSKLRNVKLYIATSYGIWKITGGKILLTEPKKD